MESLAPLKPDVVLPISFTLQKENGVNKYSIRETHGHHVAHVFMVYNVPVDLPFRVWVHNSKGEVCSFFPGFGINLLHQAGEFFEGGVHPVTNKCT